MRKISLLMVTISSLFSIQAFSSADRDPEAELTRLVTPVTSVHCINNPEMKDVQDEELKGFKDVLRPFSDAERKDLIARTGRIGTHVENQIGLTGENFSMILYFSKVSLAERENLERILTSIFRHHRRDRCCGYENKHYEFWSLVFGKDKDFISPTERIAQWNNDDSVSNVTNIILSMGKVPNLDALGCDEMYHALQGISEVSLPERNERVQNYINAFELFSKIPAERYFPNVLYSRFIRTLGSSTLARQTDVLSSFLPQMTEEQCYKILQLAGRFTALSVNWQGIASQNRNDVDARMRSIERAFNL